MWGRKRKEVNTRCSCEQIACRQLNWIPEWTSKCSYSQCLPVFHSAERRLRYLYPSTHLLLGESCPQGHSLCCPVQEVSLLVCNSQRTISHKVPGVGGKKKWSKIGHHQHQLELTKLRNRFFQSPPEPALVYSSKTWEPFSKTRDKSWNLILINKTQQPIQLCF